MVTGRTGLRIVARTPDATIRNGAMYTLSEAATAAGRNKSTVLRAIRKGRISAERREDGTYRIDAAELHRVFPPAPPAPMQEEGEGSASHDPHRGKIAVTPADGASAPALEREVAVLQVQLEASEARGAMLAEQLERERATWGAQLGREREGLEHERTASADLRQRLDLAESRVAVLLPGLRTTRGFWGRLRGR